MIFFYLNFTVRLKKHNSQADVAPQSSVKQLDSLYSSCLETSFARVFHGVSINCLPPPLLEALPTIFNSYPSDDSKSVLKVH